MFLCFISFKFLYFFLLPLRGGGMGLVKNHTTSTTQPPLMRPHHQQHSMHMHTITHQCSNYLKVLSTSLYPSISITSRYLFNYNLNLSTFSAATNFPGRPFHALTTLRVKVPYLTTILTPLFFTLRLWPLVLSLSTLLSNSSALILSIPIHYLKHLHHISS